ncbi:hypothetical protein ScPMuIL_010179 [Solemya velum]
MTVLSSVKSTIAGIQTALYHQKLLTHHYDPRVNEDTRTRLTKLETRFKNAPKAHCVAGSYSRTGFVPCELCEVGTYQASAGSTSCTTCGEGTWTSTTGSTADTDCKAHCVAGSYSSTGLVPCELCAVGTYQMSAGSTSCTACGEGTWTATTGSTADTDCKAVSITCERKKANISCPGGRIDFSYINYGRTKKEICPHNSMFTTDCRSGQAAIDAVLNACYQKTSCSLKVDNTSMGGDPCVGTHKYLEVIFFCR